MRLARTLITLLLFFFVAFGATANAAAKKQKAIVKFVTGEVLYQKKSTGKWKKVKVGSKISEKDMIRTFVESSAQLLLASGSQITVEENTIVKMSELVQDGNASSTNINVKKGRVLFNIKKLAERKSKFKFETLTATAAIRGTKGGIGFTGKRAFAYLSEGKLELRSLSGKKVDIKAKDFVIQSAKGFEVKKLENQDDLKKFLKELIDEAESTDITKIDSTISDSIDIDTTSIDTTEDADTTTVVQLSGSVSSIPPQVLLPSLTVSGTCSGTEVTVGQQKTTVTNQGWQTTITWPAEEKGEKSFEVVCSDGNTSIPIGKIAFLYGVELSLNLQTPDAIEVKNGVLNIRGSYTGSPNTKLMVSANGKVSDISSKSQFFSYVLPINDKVGTWNIDEVTLTLQDAGESDIVKTVSVSVDKSSKAVNTMPPNVSVLPNPNVGEAIIVISNATDDVIKYVVNSTEGSVEEETDKDIRYKYFLLPGQHDYEVIATDLAGNEAKKIVKNVEYWPPTNFTIDLRSPTRNGAVIPLPPRLPNIHKSQKPKEEVEVRINNLPGDDYRFIKRVTIENNEAGFKKIYENTRLDQNNRYELEVDLAPRRKNIIRVIVEPHNGSPKQVQKTITLK